MSYYPEKELNTQYGLLRVIFLGLNSVRVCCSDYVKIKTTELSLRLFIERKDNKWSFKNESHKKDDWFLKHDLPRTINAKIEDLTKEIIIPFIKENENLCFEIEKQILQDSIESTDKDISKIHIKIIELQNKKEDFQKQLAALQG